MPKRKLARTGQRRRAVKGSAILSVICRTGDALEHWRDPPRLASARRRWRRVCLRARDESVILAAFRWVGCFCLRTSLRAWGLLLLLSSLFCLLGRLWLGSFFVSSHTFLLCTVTGVAASVLLHTRQSLSRAVGSSALCGWILFRLCHLSRDRIVCFREHGEDRAWTILLAALLLGGISSILSPIWIAVAVLSVLLLCLALAAPEWIFPLTLLILPLLNLTSHPTLALCAILSIGVGSWLCKLFCGHRDFRFGVIDACVLWLGVLILLGGICTVGGRASMGEALARFTLLLGYFPIKEMMARAHYRERMMRALSCALTVVSAIGFWQYFAGVAELKWVDAERFSDIGGRVTSLFGNPNVLAVFLLLGFPTVFGAWTDAYGSERGRVELLIAALGAMGCLILTWSRGAWLGAIVAIVLFLLLISPTGRRLLAWSALPAVIWLPLLPHSIVNRFTSIGILTEGSIRYRLYTWQGVFRMLSAYPFGIGVGESAFTSVFGRFALSGTETVMHAHSLPLQIVLEHGVFGLLTFATLLLAAFCITVRTVVLRRQGERIGSVVGAASALVGVLVMGLFDYIWYHNGLFWLFFVVLAILVGGARAGTDRGIEVQYAERE